MFSYNQSNYPTKNKISKYALYPNSHKFQLKSMTIKIAQTFQVAALFGLIEQLVLSHNYEDLKRLKKSCEHILQQNRLADETSFGKFIVVISELMKGVAGEEQNTTLLKDLYTKKQSIIPYLKYFVDTANKQKLIFDLSQTFKINISLYTLKRMENNTQQIYQLTKSKQIICQQKYKFFDIKVLQILDQIQGPGYYLMYSRDPNQIDNLSRMYFRMRRLQQQNQSKNEQIISIRKQFGIKYNQLAINNNQLQQSHRKLNLKNEQLRNQLIVIEEQKQEIRNLRRQLNSVTDEKQQLSRQLRIQKNRLQKQGSYNSQYISSNQKQKQDQQSIQQRPFSNNIKNIKTESIIRKIIEIDNSNFQSQPQQVQTRKSKINILSEERNSNIKEKIDQSKYKQPKPKKKQRQMTNFLDLDIKCSTIQQKECQTCFNEMTPYQLFKCSHFSCPVCAPESIQESFKQNKFPVCLTDGCGALYQHETIKYFLRELQRKDLLQKFEKMVENQLYKDRRFDCPDCKDIVQIEPQQIFVEHCNKTFCRKCHSPHSKTQKCDIAKYSMALDFLDCPAICPVCKQIYEKIEGCEHMTCRNCHKEHPQGFCERCSAQRSTIKLHQNSYHRPDCKRFSTYNIVERKENCPQCKKAAPGTACAKPGTFKQFLQTNFNKQFAVKFLEKRAAYDAKNKK